MGESPALPDSNHEHDDDAATLIHERLARPQILDRVYGALFVGEAIADSAAQVDFNVMELLRLCKGLRKDSPEITELLEPHEALRAVHMSGLKARAAKRLAEAVSPEEASRDMSVTMYRRAEMTRRTAISILRLNPDSRNANRLPEDSGSGVGAGSSADAMGGKSDRQSSNIHRATSNGHHPTLNGRVCRGVEGGSMDGTSTGGTPAPLGESHSGPEHTADTAVAHGNRAGSRARDVFGLDGAFTKDDPGPVDAAWREQRAADRAWRGHQFVYPSQKESLSEEEMATLLAEVEAAENTHPHAGAASCGMDGTTTGGTPAPPIHTGVQPPEEVFSPPGVESPVVAASPAPSAGVGT